MDLFLRARQSRLTSADNNLARVIFAESDSSISGYRDVEIAAAAEVLIRADPSEARELVAKYLDNERNEHRLIARQLTDVLTRLGLDRSVLAAAFNAPKLRECMSQAPIAITH